MARITKLNSVYGDTRTGSKFGNLTGTYAGIQAAFYEPGGNRASPPELKASQNNLMRQRGFRCYGNIRPTPANKNVWV